MRWINCILGGRITWKKAGGVGGNWTHDWGSIIRAKSPSRWPLATSVATIGAVVTSRFVALVDIFRLLHNRVCLFLNEWHIEKFNAKNLKMGFSGLRWYRAFVVEKSDLGIVPKPQSANKADPRSPRVRAFVRKLPTSRRYINISPILTSRIISSHCPVVELWRRFSPRTTDCAKPYFVILLIFWSNSDLCWSFCWNYQQNLDNFSDIR